MEFKQSKVAVAFSILKEKILQGNYSCDVLSANSLSKELNMSKTPILEAFKLLEINGLVTVVPQVGVVVKPFNLKHIEERFAARVVLEGFMASEAAAKGSKEMKAKLALIHKEMEQCISLKNLDSFTELNVKFHSLIMDMAGNKFIKEQILQLWDINRYFDLRPLIFDEQHQLLRIAEHKDCLEAIQSADEEGARRQMELHIKTALDDYLSMIKSEYVQPAQKNAK